MSLPALATLEQLAARMPAPPAVENVTRLNNLLLDASVAVRSRCGQQITAGTTTRLRVQITPTGMVRFPQRPVGEVLEVLAPDTDLALYWEWRGDDTLWVRPNVPDNWSFEPYLRPLRSCRISYTHGYADTPDDLVAVVCAMALRAFGVDPTKAGYQMETTGPYTVQIGSAAAGGAIGMLQSEREIIDRYGYRPSAIATLPPRPIGGLF